MKGVPAGITFLPEARCRATGTGVLTALVLLLIFEQSWLTPQGVTLPATAADQQPTFRSGTQLVRVELRVSDSSGRPVTDLRREEVLVTDEGESRPIVVFEKVHASVEPAIPTKGPAEPEVSSNKGINRGNLYVLVFDQEHIERGTAQVARRHAEGFLKRHVRPGDQVAIYSLPGPGARLDFAADTTRALAELKKVHGGFEPVARGPLGPLRIFEAYEILRGNELVLRRVLMGESTAAADPDSLYRGAESGQLTPELVKANAEVIVRAADSRAQSFLGMLRDLLEALGAIEHPKSLIVFSQGFFSDNLTTKLGQVFAAAARSRSVLYTMDLNRYGDQLRLLSPVGGEQFTEIGDRIAALASLSSETGGMFVKDAASWLDKALERIALQTANYYVIGFEPSAAAANEPEKYRRIQVRVQRKGVRLAARSGYTLTRDLDVRSRIEGAFVSPFLEAGIPVEVTTYLFAGARPGQERVILVVGVQPRNRGALHVAYATRQLRSGGVVASGSERIDSKPPGTTTPAGGPIYRVQFELPQGEYLLRVVILEHGGEIGSADRHFRVSPLRKATLSASDLIPMPAASREILARPRVSVEEGLAGIMELYAPSADQLDTTVEAKLLGTHDGSVAAVGEVNLLPVAQTPRGFTRGIRVTVPLEEIPPGDYVLRAEIRAPGGTALQRSRAVEITAPSGAVPWPAPLRR